MEISKELRETIVRDSKINEEYEKYINDPENNIAIADADLILALDMLYASVVNINKEMSVQESTFKCPIDTITSLVNEATHLCPTVSLPFKKKWTFKNDIFRNKYSNPEPAEKLVPGVTAKIEIESVSQMATMVKLFTISFVNGSLVKTPVLISSDDLDKIALAVF